MKPTYEELEAQLCAAIAAVAELKVGYQLGHADVAILQDLASALEVPLQVEVPETVWPAEVAMVYSQVEGWHTVSTHY